jgi:GAF domain-containing protein
VRAVKTAAPRGVVVELVAPQGNRKVRRIIDFMQFGALLPVLEELPRAVTEPLPPVPPPPVTGTALDDAALAGCASEPIRVPGAVQPHGVLLAVREPGLEVVVASANAGELFGRQVQGARLHDLIAPDALAELADGLTGDLLDLDPVRLQVAGDDVDLTAHRTDGLLVTEWERLDRARQAGAAWHRRLPRTLQRLQAATTVQQLSDALAREVRALTAFDRVMVYRFDQQWNGEVVAEDRRADLEPFLGLRFPHSDIPPQARALYLENWLRLIPDAGYTPVPLQPATDLDLTGSSLRSVSPVHLEYLANMGVRASMSVSLISGGRLWGLVACHHYAGPHRPSPADRVAAEFLGRTASLLLATTTEAGDAERVLAVAERQARLVEALGRTPRSPAQALTQGELTVADLLPAGGAAVRLGGRLRLLGRTPPADRVEQVVGALAAGGTTATDALSRLVPSAGDLSEVASGVLAVPVVGGVDGDFLAWFRPETLREVDWGGDPGASKVVETGAGGGVRLSPRRSFARWSETVRGTSTPWRPHEVVAAAQLADHLSDVGLRRAQEESRLAATLQRTLLLEKLPEVPGVDLAAHYTPSSSDVVGGDWYDLVLLPSGRVAVVLGDVAGHGLGAAAVTAQVRHALRAYLLAEEGPAAALRRLGALVAVLLPEEMATAVVAELDPATGALRLANAGHLPPLLVASGTARLVDDVRGPALGLMSSASYDEVELALGADGRVLLYTDGLVELRGEDVGDGCERLRAAATGFAAGAQGLVDGALADLSPHAEDDVTLVALGRDG